MRSFFNEFKTGLVDVFIDAFSRFYIAIVYLLCAGVSFCVFLNTSFINQKEQYYLLLSTVFICLCAFFFNLILSIIKEKFSLNPVLWLLFVAGGVLLPVMLFMRVFYGNNTYMVTARLIVLCIGLFAVLLFLATHQKKNLDLNKSLLFILRQMAFTQIYALAFFAILSIIGALIKQMAFPKYEGLYFEYFVIATLILWIIYILGKLPDFSKELDEKQEENLHPQKYYIKVMTIFVVPVSFIMFAAALVYYTTIIIKWQMPSNSVFRISIWVCILGVLVFILSKQVKTKVCIAYRSLAPVGILAACFFAGYSMFLRINQYGVTQDRYFAMMAVIFLFLSGVVCFYDKKRIEKRMLVFLVIISVISVLPMSNFSDISIYTQVKRFDNVLRKNDMFVNQQIKPNTHVSKEDRLEITKLVEYLTSQAETNKRVYAYAPFLPADANYDLQFQTYFGFLPEREYTDSPDTEDGYEIKEVILKDKYYLVSGYDYAVTSGFELLNEAYVVTKKGEYAIEYAADNGSINQSLLLKKDNEVILTLDLSELINNASEYADEVSDALVLELGKDEMSVESKNKTIKMLAVVDSVRIESVKFENTIVEKKYWLAFNMIYISD